MSVCLSVSFHERACLVHDSFPDSIDEFAGNLEKEKPSRRPDLPPLLAASHFPPPSPPSSSRTVKALNLIMRVRRKAKDLDTAKAQKLTEVCSGTNHGKFLHNC